MMKIKAVEKLYRNGDPAVVMVCESEKRAESCLLAKYAEEMGLQLQLEYPNPTCIKHDGGKVITAEKLNAELRRCLEQRSLDVVPEQN